MPSGDDPSHKCFKTINFQFLISLILSVSGEKERLFKISVTKNFCLVDCYILYKLPTTICNGALQKVYLMKCICILTSF